MKEIKTYEDACALLKRDPLMLPDVSMLPVSQQIFLIAACKLDVIAEALNYDPKSGKSWIPDWNNGRELKWFPYFESDGSLGFAFSASYYDSWNAYTTVGSRLCFRTEKLAEYAGKQFIDLYNDFMKKNP